MHTSGGSVGVCKERMVSCVEESGGVSQSTGKDSGKSEHKGLPRTDKCGSEPIKLPASSPPGQGEHSIMLMLIFICLPCETCWPNLCRTPACCRLAWQPERWRQRRRSRAWGGCMPCCAAGLLSAAPQ